MSLRACETCSHETRLSSSAGTGSAGLCHGAANLSFLHCHLAALARPAADCSWLGTTSHLAGLFLCQPVHAAGSLLQACGGPYRDEHSSRGAAGSSRTCPCPSGGEKLCGAQARARRGRACSFPFPLPQLALCISIHGSFVHASRGTHNPMLLL